MVAVAAMPDDDMRRAAYASLDFVEGFVHMCDDGWHQGWHERNGGNASVRLLPEEVEAARVAFADKPGAWTHLGIGQPCLAGSFFLVTAAGSFMRNVAGDPARTTGIVEIDGCGERYRVVCGMGGGRPTSEFAGHALMHASRMQVQADGGDTRVLYHAHPAPVIALSKVLPPDAAAYSRVLWRAMTECVMVFPEGVGVVGCEVPGSLALARASATALSCKRAVVWAHHGLLCAGSTFDDAFGRMHAIVKAAEIYNMARMANGGSDAFASSISDDELRAIAQALNLDFQDEYLTEA